MVNAATKGGVGLNGYVERPGIDTYLAAGLRAAHLEFANGGWIADASITLEWSVDDFAISRFADSLGDTATAAEFQSRAQYWQNLFNPTTRYISPRGTMGFFRDGPGFVDSPSGFGQDGYDEGNAEQYVWWVPHNVAGLVTALGGRTAVAGRLDRFTEELNVGPNEPYLWAGNEPGFGVPWLYNYVGQPWKTQLTVDRVRGLFGPEPDGEPGNDDLGALSSWYVWAALGLYPSTPGTPILTVNTPLFDRVVIALPARQIHSDLRPGRVRTEPPEVHQRPERRRPGHRSHVASGVDHPHRRRAHVLARRLPQQGVGHRRVLRATVVRCGKFGGDRQRLPTHRHDRAGARRHRESRRATDDRRRRRLQHHRHVLRQRDHGRHRVSGQFGADGSAAVDVAITVAQSVPEEYYAVSLRTAVGESTRRSNVFVIVQAGPDEP